MKTALLIVLSLGLCALALVDPKEEVDFFVPQGWPKPRYNFENNPLSPEGFELGRSLFYDPILSKDSTVSCASCHLQYTAFAHVDHPTSHGVDSRVGKRNAPGLMNLAWAPYFHWDGGALSLNGQAVNPITHPDEMGSDLATVLSKLKRQKDYASAFKRVFGTGDIKTHHVLKALAQFTVSLVSYNSKYDQMKRKEVQFSEQEKKGYALFQQHCNQCHKEPLFTNFEFKANGIGLNLALVDSGRANITGKDKDAFLFRVPTLRNVEYSFPYMHDGRFNKLKEVVGHYAQPADWNFPISSELQKKKYSMNSAQQKDLLAFLKTLTDRGFLFNPNFSYFSLVK
jgi:cytochrome c peroxidase